MKADISEGGHRVPFIARWPGRVAAGTSSDEQIVLTDLMRTVAQIVGHELPEGSAEDSYDLAADPGEASNLWREKPEVVAQLTELLRKYQAGTRTHPLGERVTKSVSGSTSASSLIQALR